ncbi:hypothetical protein E2C01_065784 [Portunus trituberculatus]|uniref:Uncharacterized protein n=1 Tax=Portunus trituberculatus TaxID=210409 RepID=A0A5B7HQJ9_PORTR|nr:hypothetical protein [Portunus trituberculatus]
MILNWARTCRAVMTRHPDRWVMTHRARSTPGGGLCSQVKMNFKRNEIYARQFNISLSPFTSPNLVS